MPFAYSSLIAENAFTPYWSISKSDLEQYLDITYNIKNPTQTEFCINLNDNRFTTLTPTNYDLKKFPITKLSKDDKSNLKVPTNLDISSVTKTSKKCYLVNYTTFTENMQYKLGYNSVVITSVLAGVIRPYTKSIFEMQNGTIGTCWTGANADAAMAWSNNAGATWSSNNPFLATTTVASRPIGCVGTSVTPNITLMLPFDTTRDYLGTTYSASMNTDGGALVSQISDGSYSTTGVYNIDMDYNKKIYLAGSIATASDVDIIKVGGTLQEPDLNGAYANVFVDRANCGVLLYRDPTTTYVNTRSSCDSSTFTTERTSTMNAYYPVGTATSDNNWFITGYYSPNILIMNTTNDGVTWTQKQIMGWANTTNTRKTSYGYSTVHIDKYNRIYIFAHVLNTSKLVYRYRDYPTPSNWSKIKNISIKSVEVGCYTVATGSYPPSNRAGSNDYIHILYSNFSNLHYYGLPTATRTNGTTTCTCPAAAGPWNWHLQDNCVITTACTTPTDITCTGSTAGMWHIKAPITTDKWSCRATTGGYKLFSSPQGLMKIG